MSNPQMTEFNREAFESVFANAGTLRESLFGYGPIDLKATFGASSIDTTYNALQAGSPELQPYLDVLRAHDDLDAPVKTLLEKEGQAGLEGLQQVMAGSGISDPAQFAELMNDPAKRQILGQAITNVANSEDLTVEYLGEFTEAAMAASAEGANADDRRRFVDVAQRGGIDLSAMMSQQMSAGFLGFLKNIFVDGMPIDQAINQLMDGLQAAGMDATALNSARDLMEGVAPIIGLFQPGPEARRVGEAIVDGTRNIVEDVQNVARGFETMGGNISFQREVDGNERRVDLHGGPNAQIADAAFNPNSSGDRRDGAPPSPAENQNTPVPELVQTTSVYAYGR